MRNKVFVVACIAALSLMCCPPQIQAYNTTVEAAGIQPYADEIVMKLRYHNGVIQFRRWNATRNEWYDPYWRNI